LSAVEPRVPADAAGREIIGRHLDTTVIVEAAAGTGKTTELVNRIVEVLAEGRATVDRIVAVTFTEKAAGELKLRLRAGLERARHGAEAGSPRHRNLEKALARLEEARVGTIHGFCADLLRERSIEAGIDPRFESMTEAEAERLYGEAFQLWLQEQLENPPEGVRRSLRRVARRDDEGPVGRLRKAGWALVDWRDFDADWARPAFVREDRIAGLVEKLHGFADLSARCDRPDRDNFFKDTEHARRLSREIRTAEEVRSRDHDGLEGRLADLPWKIGRARRGSGKRYGEGVARKDVHAAHAALVEELRRFADDADADLAALLRSELRETIVRYERLKKRLGRLDFLDLLLATRDLVRDDTAVRADFQRRFTHLFVDEFQDTDPLQAEILLLLAADDSSVARGADVTPVPGKLFLVGDPKQSIYRFRRADVGVYFEVRDQLVERGAELVRLTTSFRSSPRIQRVVNAAFEEVMDGDRDAQQADWSPLTPWRDDDADRPAVVALPVPAPYGAWGRITKTAIQESLPEAAAGFVEWLLSESGWTVTEREKPERVPIAPRHICFLFRRFDSFWAGDITRGYVEALEARGIRHLLVGGRSFHDREEVETLRTALTAVEWPDDELAVFATLKGPLFAIGDEELLEYRLGEEGKVRRLHPFRVVDGLPERLAPVPAALELLARLHRERNRRPVAETVHRLLDATRAHATFVLRPSGEQALANVLHVAEQARTYESGGGISFRGFVERLLDDAGARRASEAPILEEGSEGVRLMTVHRAKGLEFPVVILADITADVARSTASRVIEASQGLCALRIAGWAPAELHEHQAQEVARDRAEGVRLAYVAATRARDLLVVPAVGDGAWGNPGGDTLGGWIWPLNGALYPERDAWWNPEAAPGCPRFGRDTVLDRPHDPDADPGVKPGLHRIGDRDVVWWDPAALRLRVEARQGIRREALLSREIDEETIAADVEEFRGWERGRDAAVEAASAESVRPVTAREWAASRAGSGEADDVEVIELPRDRKRPRGRRFGALVHAVLATVPLDSDGERVRGIADLQGRVLGATPEEIRAAASTVSRVLAHPLLEKAREAVVRGTCRRETPLTLYTEDGLLVEGVLDLAFRGRDGWTIVDFKTDTELEAELPAYRAQVRAYAEMLSAATGEPAHGILLKV